MEYKRIKDSYYIRIDKGENVTDCITDVCLREKIQSGYFQGIGACDQVELSTWIPEKNDFTNHYINGMLEMVSLTGNITTGTDNALFLHSHATFSYLNEQGDIILTGGHLKEARISYTGEIILNPADEKIGRMFDEDAGIEVWKLS
ncbi:MAG: DNA-binding protein [Bacteroidales bacterium]|nr:DNA-binding protein [Bacteroidales bacterium]